ncbi:hypothetical protein O3M35_000804 [Rhynocoris fuscipes]|uniref:Uncharacterized protein n=1 Tax=Rhynocoris fuscipes TaxID=488301 RepID=A0AAW1DQR4_9HEMI
MSETGPKPMSVMSLRITMAALIRVKKMAVPIEYGTLDPLLKLSKDEQTLIDDNKYIDKQREESVKLNHALDEQVEEHKVRKAAETESDKQDKIYNDDRYKEEQLKDEKERKDRRCAGEEIDKYRHMHQTKELSREFDLNDPKSLRKQLPMCTGDNDPRIQSKGSLLRFDSEDYDGQRKKNEANKLRLILEEQIREKEELKAREKFAYKNWGNTSFNEDDYNLKLKEKEKSRKETMRQIQECNLTAAHAKQKMSERNQSSSDIYSCFGTDSQTTAAGKPIVNLNNSLSNDKSSEIEDAENEKTKENEQFADSYSMNFRGIVNRQDKESTAGINSKKRDESVRIREINKKLAIEQRQRRKDLDRADHDCYPSDDFFAQFSKNKNSK